MAMLNNQRVNLCTESSFNMEKDTFQADFFIAMSPKNALKPLATNHANGVRHAHHETSSA